MYCKQFKKKRKDASMTLSMKRNRVVSQKRGFNDSRIFWAFEFTRFFDFSQILRSVLCDDVVEPVYLTRCGPEKPPQRPDVTLSIEIFVPEYCSSDRVDKLPIKGKALCFTANNNKFMFVVAATANTENWITFTFLSKLAILECHSQHSSTLCLC